MNILLIEDDAVLADGLLHTLAKNGYKLIAATNGGEAGHWLLAQDFDLIILDLCLPDMDGLTLLRKIRQRNIPIPILILTARHSLTDKIKGIEEGADDYMTKPFELKELEARIHALFRRCYSGFQDTIVVGRFSLNVRDNQILLDGKPMTLSPREYALLEILLMQAGKAVCKDKLCQRLSPEGDSLADNAIEVYIHRLRKRLEPFGVGITTLRGLGYLLKTVDA